VNSDSAGDLGVRRWAEVLLADGAVAELRALNVPQGRGRTATVRGYFNDVDKFVAAAALLDEQGASGVYVTLNPVLPALLARACNKVVAYAKNTTSDDQVLRRRFVLIDCDPVRPSGISASDEEKARARDVAERIQAFLAERGFQARIFGDSGNGFHIIIAVDLPADDEGLVRQFLDVLARRFDTLEAKVDRTVFNSSRITKVFGTMARKGDSIEDRPHRRSSILHLPDVLEVAPAGLIDAVVSELAPEKSPGTARVQIDMGGPGRRFDVDAFIRDAGLEVGKEGPWLDGRRWELKACPFNHEHKDGSAVILQFANGAVAFKCHHNGCLGRCWKDVRALYPNLFKTTPKAQRVGVTSTTVVSANDAEPALQTDSRFAISPSPGERIPRIKRETMPEGYLAELDLEPEHRELLWQSGISADVAAARGYRASKSNAELRSLGFAEKQARSPALIIPAKGFDGEVFTYQARLRHPRSEGGDLIAFEMPEQPSTSIDVPEAARSALEDETLPLVLTDAVLKADAATSAGVNALAVLGATGVLSGAVRVVLGAENGPFVLSKREVYILLDSDFTDDSCATLLWLSKVLESHGAAVQFAYLPTGSDGARCGLVEFVLAGKGIDDVALYSIEKPQPVQVEQSAGCARYEATDGGLLYWKQTADGWSAVHLTNFCARIAAEVTEDNGVEQSRRFEIEARSGAQKSRFEVASEDFSRMFWVVEHLGARAVVYAGQTVRDHARAAIQVLSTDIVQRTVYTHTGWRKIGERWVYLHAGGAIGPEGAVVGIETRLPDALALFLLPEPPTGDDLIAAVRASLALLDLLPPRVGYPLLSGVYRAPLGTTDFSEHLAGPTGSLKTAEAALMQQHWGAGMDALHLPASWSSTDNFLEMLAFTAKDALAVFDDFIPTGSKNDIARAHVKADRVLRGQGNRSGRGRLNRESKMLAPRPPRGMILSTGEDVPAGQSLRARMMVLALEPGIDKERLTAAQALGADGAYARSMSAFLKSLAPHLEQIQAQLRQRARELRAQNLAAGGHARMPTMCGELQAGFEVFLRFAVQVGAITPEECAQQQDRCWAALMEAVEEQAHFHAAAEPTAVFIEHLRSAIAAGEAHLAGLDGGKPLFGLPLVALGWWVRELKDVDVQDPKGDRVGWTDGEDLYLDLTAAHRVAQRMSSDTERLTIGIQTLGKRLEQKGFLVSKEGGRGRNSVRKTIEGTQKTVYHLRLRDLIVGVPRQSASKSSKPSNSDHDDTGKADEWTIPVDDSWSPPSESVQQNRPLGPPDAPPGDGDGRIGRLGRSSDDRAGPAPEAPGGAGPASADDGEWEEL
jgi:hypothetical protein